VLLLADGVVPFQDMFRTKSYVTPLSVRVAPSRRLALGSVVKLSRSALLPALVTPVGRACRIIAKLC
jgi:hypothetical protein